MFPENRSKSLAEVIGCEVSVWFEFVSLSWGNRKWVI